MTITKTNNHHIVDEHEIEINIENINTHQVRVPHAKAHPIDHIHPTNHHTATAAEVDQHPIEVTAGNPVTIVVKVGKITDQINIEKINIEKTNIEKTNIVNIKKVTDIEADMEKTIRKQN